MMGVTVITRGFRRIVTMMILTDGLPATNTYRTTPKSRDSKTWMTTAIGKTCRVRAAAGALGSALTGRLTGTDRGTTLNHWVSPGLPMSDGGGRLITTADGPMSVRGGTGCRAK